MTEKLIELLGLPPGSGEPEILAAVAGLQEPKEVSPNPEEEEKLQHLMFHTRMSRASAEECRAHQRQGERDVELARLKEIAEQEAVLRRWAKRLAARKNFAAEHPDLIHPLCAGAAELKNEPAETV